VSLLLEHRELLLVHYNYDQEQPSTLAPVPTSSAKSAPQEVKKAVAPEFSSASSSLESRGSMNSEDYSAMLDYMANVDGGDDPHRLGVLVATLSGDVHYSGMDMDQTEAWPISTPKSKSRSSKSTPKQVGDGTPKAARKDTPTQSQSPGRVRSPHGSFSTPTHHYRQGSGFTTPTSWGKKDKRGRVRPSPLSMQAMKDRYGSMPFVVATDPASKLVDDDALIVVPHNKAMAAAFAPSDAAHHAVEILLPPEHHLPHPPSHPSHSHSMDVDELAHAASPSTLIVVHHPEHEHSAEASSSEHDESSHSGEQEGDDTGNEDEAYTMEDSPSAGESDEESGEMEEDDGMAAGSLSDSGDYDIDDSLDDDEEDYEDEDDDDDDEYDDDDDDNDDGESDDDSDSSSVGLSSSDAGSEDGDHPHTTGTPLALRKKVLVDKMAQETEAFVKRTGMDAIPRKHDTRRTHKESPRRRREEGTSGTFMSQKKLSKAEKKKQKKKSRDDAPLEYHELQTWNGLIRDWIQHAAFGAPMPFSPMGRYQRKQLHWLAEFHGLRSQSFGSGTRRTTSVFVTKKTVLPEYSLSVAAIKAIHAGIHPFALTSDELQKRAADIESATVSKKATRAKPKKSHAASPKNRSPLITSSSSRGGKEGKRSTSARKRREKVSRQRRAREEDLDEAEEHHGLEFSLGSTAKRLVGAGAAHIPESNVGHTMLRKLGWTEGGLGREQQGIAHPIEAIIKAGRGGLGS